MKELLIVCACVIAPSMAVSCVESDLVINDFNVSPVSLKNGEELTLSVEISEETNVKDITVAFYFDDVCIGEVTSEPYSLTYLVTGCEPGIHTVTCNVSYDRKGFLVSQRGGSTYSDTVSVME